MNSVTNSVITIIIIIIITTIAGHQFSLNIVRLDRAGCCNQGMSLMILDFQSACCSVEN